MRRQYCFGRVGKLVGFFNGVADGGVPLQVSIKVQEQEAEHMILEPTAYIPLLEKHSMTKAESRATPHLQNECPSSKQTMRAESEIPDVCPQEVAVFGKSDFPSASKSEAKDIRVGSKDTIRLSWELAVVVLTADVDLELCAWCGVALCYRIGMAWFWWVGDRLVG